MAKTDYQHIDQYHLAFPAEIQERLQAIRNLVHELAPEAQEVISYQIPAFKLGKHFLVYYCAFDKHVTLSNPWTPAFLQHFEAALRPLKVSRAAIQFPHNTALPLDLIREMIAFRKMEVDLKK